MPREVTKHFIRVRIRNPKDFKKLRTVKQGTHRIIVGRLKKDDGKTHTQAILHPRKEMFPGCRGCAHRR